MSSYTDAIKEYIVKNVPGVIRVSEIRGDGEPETAEIIPANPCQNVYSVAKAFTMTAIGLLYDKGLVRPGDKVTDILKEEFPAGADERWKTVTVDMLLRHRAGLPGGFLDIDCNKSAQFTSDYLRYTFLYPLAYTPDTEERYSDGAFYLLARISDKISGKGLTEFMWNEMFTEMDFQEVAWSQCPQGHAMGATGLYLHTSDIVKLGALYLNRGVYRGKRYLSEEWVDLVKERGYAITPDEDGIIWSKGGMRGQTLMIIPSQNRAVAVTGFESDTGKVREFTKNFTD